MTFLPAGVIDGALTYAETIRRIAGYSSNGATGLAAASDLTVSALGTPGPSVVIGPGSAVIDSTYAGAAGQVYTVTNDAALTVPVPANVSGSTVTLHVLVAIRDPQYPGMPTPPDPATDLYLDVFVQATFPSDRPYVWLADVVMPAGASTVTAGMVASKARVANPRTYSDAMPSFPGEPRNMPVGTYGDWPALSQTLTVPTWATYLIVRYSVNGVAWTGTGTGVGGVRASFAGTPDTQNGIIQATGQSRQTLIVIGRWNVPSSWRGTTQPLALQGNKSSGTGNFTVDYQSQIVTEWTYQEQRG